MVDGVHVLFRVVRASSGLDGLARCSCLLESQPEALEA